LGGNVYWLGTQYNCEMLNSPSRNYSKFIPSKRIFQNITESSSPVPVQYRMFYFDYNSEMQFKFDFVVPTVLHIGLCTPESCKDDDAGVLAREIIAKSVFENSDIIESIGFKNSKLLNLRKDFYWHPVFITLM
jgi:Nose resistant-to-fluoxetine protein, N-terminal domain